jgi:hypothetical protein
MNDIEENSNRKSRGRPKLKKDNLLEELDKNIEKILKKRGRKPKIKEENEIDKIPKKRGRKPIIKVQTDVVENETNILKKRGRKRKETLYSINKPVNIPYEDPKNYTLILHLPIKSDDLKNEMLEDKLLRYNELTIPEPFENESNFMKLKKIDFNEISNNNVVENDVVENDVVENDIVENDVIENDVVGNDVVKNDVVENNEKSVYNYTTLYDNISTNNYLLNNNNNNNNKDLTNSDNYMYKNNNNNNNFINNDLINKKNNLINNNIDLYNKNNNNEKDISYSFKENKLINIRWEFIDANEKNKWPLQTNSCCLWCCHTFDNIPVALPKYYNNSKFYVSGIFCSFNCAAAYNFSKKDDQIWERYSLLNLMYKKLNECTFSKIKLAPPRETLKMFSGYLSINEFRNSFIFQNKIFKVLDPPIISLIPKIEELIVHNNADNKLYIPIDKNILENATNSEKLKLKRNVSIINNKNTLSTFMDFKIK